MNWLDRTLYGNPLLDWLIAVAVATTLLAGLWFGRRVLAGWLHVRAPRTAKPLDDYALALVGRTHFLFLLVLALYIGLHGVSLPPRTERLVGHVTLVTLLLQVALWGHHVIGLWKARLLRARGTVDGGLISSMGFIGFLGRVALWSVVVLMILDNLGANITALVASLGIGGVAVALAVQNILSDIFASLSIALDKPFVIGDFIIVDNEMGTVEHIGLKTTRLRSLSGEQIVCSNNDLLKSRLRNYKRMFERRVEFRFNVHTQTPPERLEAIPGAVRQIIEAQPKTRFDRAHFKEFGESFLTFEAVYYVLDADYNLYMDIQQAINLALMRRLAADGVGFAYPSRTLYVQNLSAPQEARAT